jgi:hypothetical protein
VSSGAENRKNRKLVFVVLRDEYSFLLLFSFLREKKKEGRIDFWKEFSLKIFSKNGNDKE